MTRDEMRTEFVIMYNNIMSNQAPGLNDHEISVFLTKAQDEELKNYYNPKGNKYQEGIDDSLKRQIDFSNLIKTVKKTPATGVSGTLIKRDPRAQLFEFPTETTEAGQLINDVMFILNEYGLLTAGSSNMSEYISVLPISYLEYQRLMTKPYKLPVYKTAWRLLQQHEDGTLTPPEKKYIEVVCRDQIAEYVIEYIRKPKPIIISDLTGTGLTIDGYILPSDCELDTIIHKEIVQRAVELAKAAYLGDLKAQVEMGQRSE